MTRYYCSGFDGNDAFGHGLGEMFQRELTDTKSIVFIPGGAEKIEKARNKQIPGFMEHFKRAGICFEQMGLITPDLSGQEARTMIRNASFVMLLGGNPFQQKELCDRLDLSGVLQKFDGVMAGFSAGAMLMSRYIIVTPCSEEYPEFQIEEGLNLDNISVYPHNNTSEESYPEALAAGGEIYQRRDLVQAAEEYGEFYLLQDNVRENGRTDVSIIKSSDGELAYYIENEGKLWKAAKDGVSLIAAGKGKQQEKGSLVRFF